MIRAEQLHNVLMTYKDSVLWIKYSDNGIEISNISTSEVITGEEELDVLKYIIGALSLVCDE